MEKLLNFVQTTLAEAGGINNSVTSFDLADASALPATGNLRLLIDNELMLYTSKSSNTVTVTRGAEGTTPTTHDEDSIVSVVLSKGAVETYVSERITAGTLSGIITAGTPSGRLYLPSDAPYIARDNGSSLDFYGPIKKIIPPVVGDFNWLNQGGATADNTNGSLFILCPTASDAQLRALKKNAPSTPYIVTVLMDPYFFADINNAGILLRESGTGKLETIRLVRLSDNMSLYVDKWTDQNNYSANRMNINWASIGCPKWLRMANNGTNISFGYSTDGYNFRTVVDVAKGNFFTSGPNEVGLFAVSDNTTYNAGAMFHSWIES